MNKIKTYEDACKALKLNPEALPDVSMLPEHHREASIAHNKLMIIAEALNEGWKPDWNNTNERKWNPYFDMHAGFGFSGTDFDYWDAVTAVGSRLCFKSSELAEYAGKQFLPIYKNLLT